MKTFQFYIKKSWFDKKDNNAKATIFLLTDIINNDAASGVVFTLNNNTLSFHYSTKNLIHVNDHLYLDVDEKYIQELLDDKLKSLFITLFFEGIDKCLKR